MSWRPELRVLLVVILFTLCLPLFLGAFLVRVGYEWALAGWDLAERAL